jgi:predicted enzyme related to lactoylglutathione lyase
MLEKVAFTMFPVKDPQRARAFYENTLGLVRGSSSKDGVWTEYDLPGGGCLALFGADANAATGSGGSIAFEVEDLDALIEHLAVHGVPVKGDIVHGPACRMAMISDSEGNPIILHELDDKAR